jgi:hypothetical protein
MRDAVQNLRKEIRSSAGRILSQLNEIQAAHAEGELLPEFGQKTQEILTVFSSLQTTESASLLEDVTKWGERRKLNFSQFEAPLLGQVEANQSITVEATDESIPRMQTHMSQYERQLTGAKLQLVSMGEEVVRVGQATIRRKQAQDGKNEISLLQLERWPSLTSVPGLLMLSEDEAVIKKMRAREQHFMAAVQTLSTEVEGLSRELVDAKMKNIHLVGGNEKLAQKIAVLEKTVASKAPLAIAPGASCHILREVLIALIKTFELDIPGNAISDATGTIGEQKKERIAHSRGVESFTLDIPPTPPQTDQTTSDCPPMSAHARRRLPRTLKDRRYYPKTFQRCHTNSHPASSATLLRPIPPTEFGCAFPSDRVSTRNRSSAANQLPPASHHHIRQPSHRLGRPARGWGVQQVG